MGGDAAQWPRAFAKCGEARAAETERVGHELVGRRPKRRYANMYANMWRYVAMPGAAWRWAAWPSDAWPISHYLPSALGVAPGRAVRCADDAVWIGPARAARVRLRTFRYVCWPRVSGAVAPVGGAQVRVSRIRYFPFCTSLPARSLCVCAVGWLCPWSAQGKIQETRLSLVCIFPEFLSRSFFPYYCALCQF